MKRAWFRSGLITLLFSISSACAAPTETRVLVAADDAVRVQSETFYWRLQSRGLYESAPVARGAREVGEVSFPQWLSLVPEGGDESASATLEVGLLGGDTGVELLATAVTDVRFIAGRRLRQELRLGESGCLLDHVCCADGEVSSVEDADFCAPRRCLGLGSDDSLCAGSATGFRCDRGQCVPVGGCAEGERRPCGGPPDGNPACVGETRCVDGAFGACEGAERLPASETCNGLDDDCDVVVDEGCETPSVDPGLNAFRDDLARDPQVPFELRGAWTAAGTVGLAVAWRGEGDDSWRPRLLELSVDEEGVALLESGDMLPTSSGPLAWDFAADTVWVRASEQGVSGDVESILIRGESPEDFAALGQFWSGPRESLDPSVAVRGTRIVYAFEDPESCVVRADLPEGTVSDEERFTSSAPAWDPTLRRTTSGYLLSWLTGPSCGGPASQLVVQRLDSELGALSAEQPLFSLDDALGSVPVEVAVEEASGRVAYCAASATSLRAGYQNVDGTVATSDLSFAPGELGFAAEATTCRLTWLDGSLVVVARTSGAGRAMIHGWLVDAVGTRRFELASGTADDLPGPPVALARDGEVFVFWTRREWSGERTDFGRLLVDSARLGIR